MSISDKVNPPNFKDIYSQALVQLTPNTSNQPNAILITGAQGMLGHGLAVAISKLLKMTSSNKSRLFLASRNWSNRESSIWKDDLNCELITNEQIPFIRQQIDLVLHTASPSNVTQISSFGELEWANLGILRSILEINPTKIVYISSGEVYGGGQTDEEQTFNGFSKNHVRDWYPITKLAAENELRNFQKNQELEVCVIRLFHTFGPGVKADDGRSFADVLWGAAIKNEIVLKSTGEQVRTFLYLSDALDGVLSLAFNRILGFSVINLGSPTPTSIYEFAKIVGSISGATIKINSTGKFQHSPNKTIVPNVERMIQRGWSQKTTLEDGIRLTMNWIKNSTLAQS